jgi:hypothetical protein
MPATLPTTMLPVALVMQRGSQMPLIAKVWEGMKTRARFARNWLRDLRGVGWWLLSVMILLALPSLWSSGTARVQWQGVFLQWAGVIVVAWGLAETRREVFGKTPLRTELWSRIRRLRYIINPPPPIVASMAVHEAGDTLQATVIVRQKVEGTLEERVTTLTDNVLRMDHDLAVLQQDIQVLRRETSEHIVSERQNREEAERAIRNQIEEAIIGGIHLEIAGVGYLLIATLLSGVPEYVASVLQKIGV